MQIVWLCGVDAPAGGGCREIERRFRLALETATRGVAGWRGRIRTFDPLIQRTPDVSLGGCLDAADHGKIFHWRAGQESDVRVP